VRYLPLRFAVPILLLSLGLPTLASAQYSTPTIVIDYTYDTNTFFTAGSAQRTALETAASRLSSRLGDTLTAINYAGLADVGWQVSPIPEPTTVLGFACSAFAVGCGLRRRFAKAI